MTLIKETGFSDVRVLGRRRYGIISIEKAVINCKVDICNLFEFMLKLEV